MGPPTISVVTPSYNHGEFLEDLIVSIKRQEYSCSIEHVVVDADSSDDTVEILERHSSGYDLRWVSEPDRGQTNAVNKGIGIANGDWIVWQNADDYFLPGAFAAFEEAVETTPESEVVYGDIQLVDVDGELMYERQFTRPSRLIQRYLSNFMANQAAFIRADLFDRLGPLNERYEYAMDVELFWKLLNYGGTYTHLREPIAAIRIHDDTKSEDSRDAQSNQGDVITRSMDRPAPFERFLSDRQLQRIARLLRAGYLMCEGRASLLFEKLRLNITTNR